MDSDIGTKLQRRREALKDSLRTTGNEASLLRDLKERRLQRLSQLTPLKRSVPVLEAPGEIRTTEFNSKNDTSEQGLQGLRQMREQGKSTRFDELVSESGLPTQFQSQSSSKRNKFSRWKVLSNKITDVIKKSDDQDSYDFFTSALDDSHELSRTVPENQDFQQNLLGEEGTIDDEEAPSAGVDADFFYIDGLQHPLYTPHQQRLDSEGQVYFRPTSMLEPRDTGSEQGMDEEGFYVGEKPTIASSRIKTMENRILQRKAEDLGWFGDDDLLLIQSNPLRTLHTRPHILQSDYTQHSHFQLAEIKSNDGKYIDQETDVVYQLELDISSVQFLHHPLFSFEHILSSELEQAYQIYSSRDKNAPEYYYQKLHALKTKVAHLKQTLKEAKDLPKMEIQSYINIYRKEISTIRQHRKKIIESEYSMLKKILRLWKCLKDLRDNQGYSNTTSWLVINKVETNAVEEEAKLRRELEDEFDEVLEDFQDQYIKQQQDYHLRLSKWKKEQLGKLNQNGDEVAEDTFADELLASVSRESRPMPPAAFDELKTRQELSEYYQNHFKPPGEPLFIPELHHTNAITQQCPADEQLRRDDTSRTRLHIKIFFNDQQVSQTKESNLNSDFSVYFGEVFTIQIVQWPESIKLQIFESKLLTSNVVAEVYIPIPEVQQTSKSLTGTEQYQFTSNKVSTFTHSAVGSGNCHPSFPEAGVLLTTGTVKAAICWGVDVSGKILCPHDYTQSRILSSKHADAVASLGVSCITNLQEVKKWIDNSRLDPNDPRNAELLQLIESIPSSSEELDYFQLASVDDVQTYISDNEFNMDKRFTMLSMRDRGHNGLKNKVVPLSSKSISGSVWKKMLEFKDADYELPLLILGDFYTKRKEEQNKFLLDIRERVLTQIRSRKSIPLLSEVVISEFIPNISALKSTLLELLTPKRPLKPVRRERKRLKAQNLDITNANVVVRVIRAFNVPVRDDNAENLHTQSTRRSTQLDFSLFGQGGLTNEYQPHEVDTRDENTPYGGKDVGVVSPYVEVSYGDTVLHTTRGCGQNPFWNEELIIPIQLSDGDFSRSKLQMITNKIHFNLFDEVIVDILEDDRKRPTTVHNRIEKRWLGKFTLPFSTLLLRKTVEGTFQLDVPLMLLGYNKNYSPEHNPLLGFSTSHHTHLQIFVNLDPPLDILPPIKDHQFPSSEEMFMLEHASKWLKALRENFPSRYYTATALDISAKHVFVTRYIKPQNPPLEISSLETENRIKLMECLAHYVSLIPFLSDAIVFSENCNIWTTSDQFLQMLGGDEEEHATLLCNYFLFCGFRAWVLLGHAVPEGETAYVLTEDPQPAAVGYWLWNPSNGVHYSQHEPHTPLVSVGCVFNDNNVWGNIQVYDDPSRMMFDLSNRKHWYPLYSDSYEPPASVQQDLHYSETDNGSVMELQERIERSLRDHIMKLRNHITRWNRHCARILQALLPMLEGSVSPPLHDCYNELTEITSSYQLTGFPIHIRYSDIQQLLRTVERTGIHLCEDKKVEYALAVYVHSYPNDIISVWIYVVSMIPK